MIIGSYSQELSCIRTDTLTDSIVYSLFEYTKKRKSIKYYLHILISGVTRGGHARALEKVVISSTKILHYSVSHTAIKNLLVNDIRRKELNLADQLMDKQSLLAR
jgi:hypothetical protein